MGGPGVILVHTPPMGTLSSLGRMLPHGQGNSHGRLPGSREHGTEQSRVGRREGREGVGCRHLMAQGRPWVRVGQQGAWGGQSRVFTRGGHWCPSPPACPFPTSHLLTLPPLMHVASPATFPPCPPPQLSHPSISSLGQPFRPFLSPPKRRQRLVPFSGPLDKPPQPRTHIVHGASKLCGGKTPAALTAPGLQPPDQNPLAPAAQGPLPASLSHTAGGPSTGGRWV